MSPVQPRPHQPPTVPPKVKLSLYSVFAPVTHSSCSLVSSSDSDTSSTRSSRRPLPQPPRPARRPLPQPPPLHRTSSQSSFQSASSLASSAPPSHTPSLIDVSDTAVRSEPPDAYVLAAPSPVSPLVFAFPPMPKERESVLAQRMRELGFVEDALPHLPVPSEKLDAPADADADALDVVLLLDDSDTGHEFATDILPNPWEPVKSVLQTATRRSVSGVAETESSFKAKRFSRKWVREKKGRRWVERDYDEVMRELRKLR